MRNKILKNKVHIVWLQDILRDRLSEDIQLTLEEKNKNVWKIKFPFSKKFISLSYISSLYKSGYNPNLPCGYIKLTKNYPGLIDLSLPSPGLDKNPRKIFIQNNDFFHINYDIIGLIYWCLTRSEEVDIPEIYLDKHKRFSSIYSHAYKNNYLQRPIVDEWINLLKELIKQFIPNITFKEFHFKQYITHDVDSPARYALKSKYSFFKQIFYNLLKKDADIDFSESLKIYTSSKKFIHQNDPHNTFKWLMDKSEELNTFSSFNFFSGITNKKLDASYRLDHLAIVNLIKSIKSRGHNIGIHPSYETYKNYSLFKKEENNFFELMNQIKIDQNEWGGRMHYLRWSWPYTGLLWSDSRFNYDSSLGYADSPGFRCGTCHEFRMFDPKSQKILNFKQRPLIFMECSVLDRKYQNLGYNKDSIKSIICLKDACKIVNGTFTILWHNSYFRSYKDKNFYTEVIEN